METLTKFRFGVRFCLVIATIFACELHAVLAADGLSTSNWDKGFLSVEFTNVQINANSILGSWKDVSIKYLLRANFYESTEIDNQRTFIYHNDKATGAEILNAFLATYTDYTYTQNPETGIIWIHPKTVKYLDLLNETICVAHGGSQIPMYTCIYLPLCRLLAPSVIDSLDAPQVLTYMTGRNQPISSSWLFGVDLQVGTYSVRQILDMICLANPTKAFLVQQGPESGKQGQRVIFPTDLVSDNPFTAPRLQAVKFWEVEVSGTIDGTPSYEKVRAAMSNSDPKVRTAASLYVESSMMSYSPLALITNVDNSDQAVWTALGVEYAGFRDYDTNYFETLIRRIPRLGEDLKRIENPNLALLALLQLTREEQDTSYLDAIVNKHKYTESEIASIIPELVRMARSSKAVRYKLLEMKSQVPDLSPEVLGELANTNSFLVLPQESK